MSHLDPQPSDVLLTLAEVSVAFVGFASIVAVFRSRWSQGEPAFDLFRFWVMLAFGLAALLFALLPFPLHFLIDIPSLVWRISSLTLAAFIVAMAAVILRLASRGDPIVTASRTRGITAAAQVLYGLIVFSQIANALGYGGGPSFGPYLFGLFLVLVGAGINFVRLMWVSSARLGPSG